MAAGAGAGLAGAGLGLAEAEPDCLITKCTVIPGTRVTIPRVWIQKVRLTIFHMMIMQIFSIFHDLSSKDETKIFNWSIGELE